MLTSLRFLVITWQGNYQIARYLAGRFVLLLFFFRWDRTERLARRNRLRALCFTDFFRNLSATFIKIGQILSSRPDILPPYIIDELKLLQDHVPAFAFHHVEQTFREEFQKELSDIFERFDPVPIAAASIAQVHEGILKTGGRVAVKVQRPDIETKMGRDLAVLCFLAWVSDHLPYLSLFHLTPVAETFADAIRAQLNLKLEADNNRRFHKDLADIPYVHFPTLYDDYCSRRVITMEFCEGMKIDEVVRKPPIAREVLAERFFTIYSNMAYLHQFVHADLHPGNVFIDHQGRFILIDTGLVADIPKPYIKRFLQLAIAMSTIDGPILVRTYFEGREGPPISEKTLKLAEIDAKAISDKLQGKALKDIEFGVVFLEMFALLRKYKIWMEPELTMMFVSDITVEGMAKALDPDFDMLSFLQKSMPGFLAKLDWLKPGDLVLKFYSGKGKA